MLWQRVLTALLLVPLPGLNVAGSALPVVDLEVEHGHADPVLDGTGDLGPGHGATREDERQERQHGTGARHR